MDEKQVTQLGDKRSIDYIEHLERELAEKSRDLDSLFKELESLTDALSLANTRGALASREGLRPLILLINPAARYVRKLASGVRRRVHALTRRALRLACRPSSAYPCERTGLTKTRRADEIGSAGGRLPNRDLRYDPRPAVPFEAEETGRPAKFVLDRRPNILVIDHRIPSPDRDSGSVRIVEIIRSLLRRGHSVTFIPANFVSWQPYEQHLRKLGVNVVLPPDYHSSTEYLRRHGPRLDLVVLCRVDVAERHIPLVRRYAPHAKVVFDTVDLHFLREQRHATICPDTANASELLDRKRHELGLVERTDLTVVVSEQEKAVIEGECTSARVLVVPNIIAMDSSPRSAIEGRNGIIFIGGFDHAPNVDAVLYFAEEIFPRIAPVIPQAVFHVVGSYPTPEILALSSSRIKVLGYVRDVQRLFDLSRVAVAPLRFGAGVKGKVNQSMALGVPTVVTSIAAEGMQLVHEHNAMIADDPVEFAEAVISLWKSTELWSKLSSNGRENVREHFSVEVADRRISDLLQAVGLEEETHHRESVEAHQTETQSHY